MRKLIPFACLATVLATLAGAAHGADPGIGDLSVEGARGVVVLDVRGSVLGRLAQGSLTITDRTPNDAFIANVTGRRIVLQRRLGPAKVLIRGQGLRFRLLGGSYRIVIRGAGISVSAVGRGVVSLDGEPRFVGDSLGVYSLDGIDCGLEPQNCLPVPEEGVRSRLDEPVEDESGRTGSRAR